MIFLKKFISSGIITIFSGVFLCGCTTGTHKVPQVSITDEPVTTTAVSTTVSGEDRLIDVQEGVFIYDKASTLTNTEYSECNEYAKMLYKDYLLNAAVVITNDLEGMSTDQYAAEAYDNIFNGMGSGILFLVNNDTQEDILYKTGHCQRFIDNVSERDELYCATKELVVGNYKEAAMIMMKLGEKCPKNVIDNSNIFSEDVTSELSGSLDVCANKLALIATNNASGISNDELARMYCTRRYGEGNGYIAIIDKKTRTVTCVTNGELSPEITEIVSSANNIAANNDFIGAANKLVSGFGGIPLTISERTTELSETEDESAGEDDE